MKTLSMVAFTVTFAALLQGCSKKGDTPQPPADAAPPKNTAAAADLPPATPPVLADILAAWNAGRQQQALDMLLRTDWERPDAFAGSPAFLASEQQLVEMPRQQRDQLVNLAMADSRTLRALAKYAVSTAENKAAAGDTEAAEKHLTALFNCGRAWQNPQRLEIIQLTGRALTTIAYNNLKKLNPTRTP